MTTSPNGKELKEEIAERIFERGEYFKASVDSEPVMYRSQIISLIVEALAEYSASLFTAHCEFLESKGYLDSDWRDEEPTALQQFKQTKGNG